MTITHQDFESLTRLLAESTQMNRREMLALVGGGVLSSLLVSSVATAVPAPPQKNRLLEPLYYSSASAIADAIRKKEISSEEVVQAFLERTEEVNPKINAVVQQANDEALRLARAADRAVAFAEPLGPLHGVPFTLKDSIDTAGLISTGGTLGRANYLPTRDATVAKRLRAAGAILIGKTNTPELTFSYNTDNFVYGQTYNPYDLTKSPGGSSGGAAAILAAGGAPLDVGSDSGGSIRLPSHWCGISGIKPTSGRVPRTGHIWPFGGVADSLTQLGPMARYVDDLILTLPLIAGVDWRDPAIIPMPLGNPVSVRLKSLRVSFHTDNGIATPTSETVETVRRAASQLAELGVFVEEVRPDGIEDSQGLLMALVMADGGIRVRKLLSRVGTTRHSFGWLENSKPLPMDQFSDLIDRWDSLRSRMVTFLENYDVILSPVNSSPALPFDEISSTDNSFSYTQAYNLTGLPSVVVRAGISAEGLPIGIQIIARPWREDVALAVAKHLEMVLGGFQPPS